MPELMPDLLPCPFCGVAAKAMEGSRPGAFFVWHLAGEKFCPLGNMTFSVKAWNTRPPHNDTVRLEMLAAHMEYFMGRGERGFFRFPGTMPPVESERGDGACTLNDLRTALDALHGPTEEV